MDSVPGLVLGGIGGRSLLLVEVVETVAVAPDVDGSQELSLGIVSPETAITITGCGDAWLGSAAFAVAALLLDRSWLSANLLLLVEGMMSGLLDVDGAGAGALFAATTDDGDGELVLSANSVEKLSLIIMEFTICYLIFYVISTIAAPARSARLVSAGHG